MRQQQLDEKVSPLERMIREQVMDRGIREPRLLDALRSIPRERFFPADQRDHAFADRATPIACGQTISQPFMVALMTSRLDVQPTHRVLEIGTGSGYQTAVLARLAREVFTIERVKPLLDEAWERLMELGIRNVHFRHADGTLGWPDANGRRFDRILIAASAPALPRNLLLSQLQEGGLAVLPVGTDSEQMLVIVKRDGDTLIEEKLAPVRFVKLIGREGWSETEIK